jgi:hypothetical protein
VARELAIEFAEERYSAGKAKLGTGRREHGIFAGRCAIDDEARAGKVSGRGRRAWDR